MAPEVRRFRFDFDDLAPAPRPALRVVPLLEPAPALTPVEAVTRPRWLGVMLPVIRRGEPLRARFAASGSPAHARLLRDMVACVIASAGATAGVRVVLCDDYLVAGCHGLDRVPEVAQVTVSVAEPMPWSVAAAREQLAALPQEERWLVLQGGRPELDAALGLGAEPFASMPPARIVRLPALSRRDLCSLFLAPSRGLPASRLGRACAGLAAAILRSYREVEL